MIERREDLLVQLAIAVAGLSVAGPEEARQDSNRERFADTPKAICRSLVRSRVNSSSRFVLWASLNA